MAYARAFAAASRRYRPEPIRLLFIAEAPPALESGRFFYFTSLTRGDTLFLEMMKVLYPVDIGFVEYDDGRRSGFDVRRVRESKEKLLQRFKSDGFYLIDASEQPMPADADGAAKRKIMREALQKLRAKVRRLVRDGDVRVILIGGVTYSVCAAALRQDGVRVLNEEMIDHPARGGQRRFRRKLGDILRSHRLIRGARARRGGDSGA